MELYLDTANVAEVERLARIFPIAGVTTNPSIVAASGESVWEVLPRPLAPPCVLLSSILRTRRHLSKNTAPCALTRWRRYR